MLEIVDEIIHLLYYSMIVIVVWTFSGWSLMIKCIMFPCIVHCFVLLMLMFEKGDVYFLWYCGIICCQVDVFRYGTKVLSLRMSCFSL